MIGLLLKDYYTLIKQAKLFILFILVFAILPGMSMTSFAIIYASMLPITAIAYDERAKWDSLAVMMPYTPKQIVFSKYVLGYVCIVAAAIFAIGIKAVTGIVQHTATTSETYFSILLMACVALLILAVNLPIIFKFGVEKGRIAFILIIVLVALAGMALIEKVSVFLSAVTLGLGVIILGIGVCIVIINGLSIYLSTTIYKRKTL